MVVELFIVLSFEVLSWASQILIVFGIAEKNQHFPEL
jgi:hypothetical protein